MSTPRLLFLYPPQLWQLPRPCERAGPLYHWVSQQRRTRSGKLSCSVLRRHQTTIPQRHGTAVEPIPESKADATRPTKPAKASTKDPKKVATDEAKRKPNTSPPSSAAVGNRSNAAAGEATKTEVREVSRGHIVRKPVEPSAAPGAPADALLNANPPPPEDATSRAPGSPSPESMALETVAATRPLETVLHVESPGTSRAQARRRTPHLEAPPYVHHFDTYTLVKDLSKGGFTYDQSVTVMKAVRSSLAVNMDLAHDGLVSKSDVENESYLFRAACSELRTEVTAGRQAATEKMHGQRAHLQHDVDLLGQRVTQETQALKDHLKGMFDDRKMAVRMEQRTMDTAIAELNYKITVAMTGDAKGEVEGLRWVLTRRAAMGIVGMALFMFGFLRYTHHVAQTQEQERAKKAKLKEAEVSFRPSPASDDRRSGVGNGSADDGNGQTEAMLAAQLESGGA